jgi:hypothetical protein
MAVKIVQCCFIVVMLLSLLMLFYSIIVIPVRPSFQADAVTLSVPELAQENHYKEVRDALRGGVRTRVLIGVVFGGLLFVASATGLIAMKAMQETSNNKAETPDGDEIKG